MNLQAVIVERDAGNPMISGFHALYSMGGIVGAAGCTPVRNPGLLPYGHDSKEKPRLCVIPKGIVLFVGMLCFICFLTERAIRDWSALFLTSSRDVEPALAGFGYAMFAAR